MATNSNTDQVAQLVAVNRELAKRLKSASEAAAKAAADKAALEKSAAEKADAVKQAGEKLAAASRVAVKALVDNDRIFAEQQDEVLAKIAGEGGHLAAVELLGDLAAHRNSVEAGLVPAGGPVKTASARRSAIDSRVFDPNQFDGADEFRDGILTRI